MDWKNGYRKNKGKLLVIGASALVLALIAFSGICLGTLKLCGLRNAAASWGFWEIFGVLSIFMIAYLVIRPLRNRRRDGEAPAPIEIPPNEPLDTAPRDTAPRADWRQLCDQLSTDDREALKALMAKGLGEEG